jgi:hypothetical protein
MSTTSLGQCFHGAWNVRQGGAGVGTDVSYKGTVQPGWLFFPKLIIPQYDEVIQGSHCYVLHTFRQSGVDDAKGWSTSLWIAQPVLLSGGAKAVYWYQWNYNQANYSTNRVFMCTQNLSASISSLLNWNNTTLVDSTSPYYIVLDCYYSDDGSYNHKGTFSRL